MAMVKKARPQWQCDLIGPKQKLEYLFNTGCFSDIIINCPSGTTFELHRIVLAMCSPVFEAMIFGSLDNINNSLCLEDDPEILKYLFAHCYGCDIQCNDIFVMLKILKMADKYILHDLKHVCTVLIHNHIKAENFKAVFEFSFKYGFNDLRKSCIIFLQQDNNSIKATSILKWLSQNSPRDLLMPVFAVNRLIFDTWRNPKSDEPFDDIVTILQSNCCNDLQIFAGQVPGEIIKYIPGPLRAPVSDIRDPSYAPVLKFSLSKSNADDVITELIERYNKYGPEDIGIHITNKDLPSIFTHLFKLPCYNCNSDEVYPNGRVTLYFSDITMEDLYSIDHMIFYLQPNCGWDHLYIYSYMFLRCKFTKEDFNTFAENIFHKEYFLPNQYRIWISPVMEMKENIDPLDFKAKLLFEPGIEEIFSYLKVISSENEIPGW